MIFRILRIGFAKITLVLSVFFVAAGCSTLPAYGPSSNKIVHAGQRDETQIEKPMEYRLIDISSSTLPVPESDPSRFFSPNFLAQNFIASNQRVIPGDIITIRVWEAADDGLFATKGQRETLFTLTVSNSGTIDVPYAGNISVAQKSVHEIREILLKRYRGKAIDPEINVEVKETISRGVSVLGAVASPGRITIPSQGIKLLDVIALSGGIPYPDWEVTVKVTRGNASSSLKLDRVLKSPRNNIVILPNDSLFIEQLPRRFAVYGAITKPGNISVDAPSPKLSDLLAESGGLDDMQAEASSVFVFRSSPDQDKKKDEIPTAYRIDFAKPEAFLLANKFKVSPSDIVYVATADATEFRKFVITWLSPLFGSTRGVQSLGN